MSSCSSQPLPAGRPGDLSVPDIAVLARSSGFQTYLKGLLVELCAIDTTPRPDVREAARAESHVFDIIRREITGFDIGHTTLHRAPIDPKIEGHSFFTPLYYTQTRENPRGLGADLGYAGRGNLLLFVDGAEQAPGGVGQAVNVHIDVVAPYMPPRVEGDLVFGRGAGDDKGNVVAFLGALKLIGRFLRKSNKPLHGLLTGMFVIDEETGGNGSLSCAMDRGLKSRYDSLLVLECTDGRPHPANRGCVWYKITGELPGVNLFEASSFIVEELEREGRAIRAESNHPLFPHRPVQTCHGVIGHCGEHPSSVNADVSFRIEFESPADVPGSRRLIGARLIDGLREYVEMYGDKANKTATEQRGDSAHYDTCDGANGITVHVRGRAGHMGAVQDSDGAITKMSALVRALVRERAAIEAAAGGPMHLTLEGWPDASTLLMEGGQGFLPTHTLDEVEQRLRQATRRGARRYGELVGLNADAEKALHISYDRLHNAAFARRTDSPDMLNVIAAAKDAGLWKEEPLRGWEASCDARIFACEYPLMPVITMGAGTLASAHSEREQVDTRDVARMAESLCYFILRQTGTV